MKEERLICRLLLWSTLFYVGVNLVLTTALCTSAGNPISQLRK
jgi:hypothetical protein